MTRGRVRRRGSARAAAVLAALGAAAGLAGPTEIRAEEASPPDAAGQPAPAEAAQTATPASPPVTTAAALRADTWRAVGITAGALVADGVVTSQWKTTACRICGAGALDEQVRAALAWSDPAAASRASDILAKGVLPLLAGADALRATRTWGDAGRDALVVVEAASISNLLTDVAKAGFARRRPTAPMTGGGAADYHSLWSSHTSLAFSVVCAQAMQDSLRGDEAAPWVWAVGLTLAAGVGYLRVGADAHWFTDVLAGAAAGAAVGVAVPLLQVRLVRGVTLVPAPGGIALRYQPDV